MSYKYLFVSIVFISSIISRGYSQENSSEQNAIKYIYLQENFEKIGLPDGWQNNYVEGTSDWKYQDGGYQMGSAQNGGTPPHAKQGALNAIFKINEENSWATKLITAPINLEYAKKPELRFWHAQAIFLPTGKNDKLKVFFKNGKNGTWTEIRSVTNNVEEWEQVTIPLDIDISQSYSTNCYVAFEGTNNSGNGVCIDSVLVVETAIIEREIKEITINEFDNTNIRTGASKTPISKFTINVAGNTNQAIIDKIALTSECTDINDLEPSEIFLYYAADDNFSASTKIAIPGVINGNKVEFLNVNQQLLTGVNYLWVTVKVKKDATPSNLVGFSLKQNDLTSNLKTYPASDLTYNVNKQIQTSVFFDDFETDKGWNLNQTSSEWQREIPTGLRANKGNANPLFANSYDYILGTDITGLGLTPGSYEAGLPRNGYVAESPIVDLTYYKNVHINFYRYTNIGQRDTATIDISNDKGIKWQTIWYSGDSESDDKWRYEDFDISKIADKKADIKVRFTVGPTREEFSGWNIDDFAFTGEYLVKDLGILSIKNPFSGCGNTKEEPIQIEIKNFASVKSPINAKIKFSLDGVNFIEEEIGKEILPSEIAVIELKTRIDLSTPFLYNKIVAEIILDGDQDLTNNTLSKKLLIQPTVTPPYSTSFEEATCFWLTKEDNPLWLKAIPMGYKINKAATGANALITNPAGAYSSELTEENIESPCFNLTGLQKPTIEFKIWKQTLKEEAGLTLSYSTDNGTTWIPIQNTEDYDSYWNWYSGNYLDITKCDGFAGQTDDYITVRHFLPAEVLNVDCIKFSLTFKSIKNPNGLEGFSVDDFKVFDAPKTIKLTQISEANSQCNLSDNEEITVSFINNWFMEIKTGHVFNFSLEVNNTNISTEEFILDIPLAINQEKSFTFSKKVDLSTDGQYNIKVSTTSNPEIGFYNNENNNTVEKNITIAKAVVDLGADFSTALPDTVTLTVGNNLPADQTYFWNDNTAITGTSFKVTSGGTYKVTATRNGCSITDEITITDLKRDIGFSKVISPVTSCGFSKNEQIVIEIANVGNETFKSGEEITVGIKPTTTDSYYYETFTLTESLAPSQTLEYTFNKTLDLSTDPADKYLGFTAKAKFRDEDSSNDSYDHNFKAFGYTPYEFGVEKITIAGTTTTLDARTGWTAYQWVPGGNTQVINTDKIGWHYITVFDNNNCPTTDSVYVNLIYSDIKPDNIIAPASKCETTAPENIAIEIINSGSVIIEKGKTISIDYNFKGNALTQEEIVLQEDLLPNQKISHTSNNSVFIEDNLSTLSITTKLKDKVDNKPQNDTKTEDIVIFGYPTASFGSDKIVTDNFPYVLDPGVHQSYLWQDGSTNQTYTASKTGQYSVVLTDNNICSATANIEIEFLTVDLIPSILSPKSNCSHANNEPIIIEIENKGNSKLLAGKIIDIDINIDGVITTEQIKLEADLLSNDKQQFTLLKQADLSAIKEYSISIETKLPTDYDNSNNSTTQKINTFGFPELSLGDDREIRTAKFTIDAGDFVSYLWSTGETTRSITITETGNYSVTVTNENGCSNSDEVHIKMITPDLAITQMVSPISKCENTAAEEVIVTVKNTGDDIITAGTNLTFKLLINDVEYLSDLVTRPTDINPGDSFDYKFSSTINLSNIDDYNIKAILQFDDDIILENNKLEKTIKTTGYPFINLGNSKTIYDPYKLECGSWSSYSWNTGSTEPYIMVNKTGNYAVTVTNEIGCSGNDEVDITFQKAELEITNIISPTSKCLGDISAQDNNISFTIKNSGEREYAANEKIKFQYTWNSSAAITEYIEIPYDMPYAKEATINFATPLANNISGEHSLSVTSLPSESAKNTKTVAVSTYAHPEVPFKTKALKEKLPYVLVSPVDAENYLWNTAETTKSITVNTAGVYSLELTNKNNCKSSIEFNIEAAIASAINQGKVKIDAKIWPNPASNVLNISIPTTSKVQKILVVSTNGKVYIVPSSIVDNGNIIVDISKIASGSYSIIVITEKEYINNTFIKK